MHKVNAKCLNQPAFLLIMIGTLLFSDFKHNPLEWGVGVSGFCALIVFDLLFSQATSYLCEPFSLSIYPLINNTIQTLKGIFKQSGNGETAYTPNSKCTPVTTMLTAVHRSNFSAPKLILKQYTNQRQCTVKGKLYTNPRVDQSYFIAPLYSHVFHEN